MRAWGVWRSKCRDGWVSFPRIASSPRRVPFDDSTRVRSASRVQTHSMLTSREIWILRVVYSRDRWPLNVCPSPKWSLPQPAAPDASEDSTRHRSRTSRLADTGPDFGHLRPINFRLRRHVTATHPPPRTTTMAEEQYYTRALFQGLRIIWESTHRYLESIGLGSPAAVIRLAAAMGQVTTASLVARLPGVNEAVAESTSRWLERRQSSLQALFEIPSSSVASARPALALDTPITAHVGYVPGPPGVFIPLWWAAAIAVVLCFVGVVVLAHLVEAGVFRGWRRRPVASAAQRAADVEERIQRQPERVAGDPRPDLDALVPTLLEFLCVLAEAIRVEPPASLAAARASNRNGHPVDPLAAPEREHVEAAPDPHPVPKTAYLDAVVEGAETLLTRFPLEIRSTPTSTTPSHFAPMRVLAAQQALIDSPALPRARVAKAPITPAAPLSSAPTDGRSLVASPLEDWVGPDDWLDTDPFASPTPRASTSTAVPFVPRRFSSAADGETDYKRRDVGEEQEEADEQVEVLQNPADRKGKGRAEWR